jgi:methyl-accepting chemotaxis protein
MHLAMNGIGEASKSVYMVTNLLIGIPIVLFLVVLYLYYFVEKEHKQLPLLITLTLTFTSIGIIATGQGMIEYHFSIFMVIAIIAYFDSIKNILVSTVIFALHHFVGYFTMPEILCGTNNYHFSVLMIHAVFLIVTSLVTSYMIYTHKKSRQQLELESDVKKNELDEVLSNLVNTMHHLNDTSTNLLNNVEETMETSHLIDSSMREVREGTNSQSVSTRECSRALEEVAEGTTEIAGAAGSVSKQSKKTLEETQSGEKALTKMELQMKNINDSVENLASIITVLNEKSKVIEEVIQIISGISNQTNLLALNAAIEAARAGELGKGFAVVAEEVRNLAEQSQHSASEISELVKDIQLYTDKANTAMKSGLEEVKEGTEVVYETGKVFQNIVFATNAVNNEITKVVSIAEEVAAASEEVTATVEHVSEIAEITSESTHIISEGVTKQKQHIEEIYKVSENLKGTTDQLQELINKFTNRK